MLRWHLRYFLLLLSQEPLRRRHKAIPVITKENK